MEIVPREKVIAYTSFVETTRKEKIVNDIFRNSVSANVPRNNAKKRTLERRTKKTFRDIRRLTNDDV